MYHPVSCTSGTTSSCNLNANFPGETARNATFSEPAAVRGRALGEPWHPRAELGDRRAARHTPCARRAVAALSRSGRHEQQRHDHQSGFAKDYTYDQRLHYESPPHFLDPIASQWQENTWAELKNPVGPPGVAAPASRNAAWVLRWTG